MLVLPNLCCSFFLLLFFTAIYVSIALLTITFKITVVVVTLIKFAPSLCVSLLLLCVGLFASFLCWSLFFLWWSLCFFSCAGLFASFRFWSLCFYSMVVPLLLFYVGLCFFSMLVPLLLFYVGLFASSLIATTILAKINWRR